MPPVLCRLALLVLTGLLAACVPAEFGTGRAATQIALTGGVTLAAPRGYCVDSGSTRDRAEGGFVLFGNCAAIARDASRAQPAYPALLSATLGPAGGGPAALRPETVEGFFRSEAGRAVLARSGQAGDVELLAVRRVDDLLLLKIRDASAGGGGLQKGASYWRAITALGGRIAAFSVLPLEGARLSDTDQVGLLKAFVGASRAASAAKVASGSPTAG